MDTQHPHPPDKTSKIVAILRGEWEALSTIRQSDRPWQMPLAAGVACGLPLVLGAMMDRMEYGLVASLGGLVFIHLPATPMAHRMATIMACAFTMTASYTLGVLSHFIPILMMPTLVFTSIVVTMLVRYYALPAPGSLFFIMAAAIGAYTPMKPLDVPLHVGLISMGTLIACLVGFVYSLVILRKRPPLQVQPLPQATFDYVVFDSVIIGISIGVALAIAQLLKLEKAYWVPVSCVAVIQGQTLRAIWTRHLHRIVGTALGLGVTWAIFLLPLDKWMVAALVTILMIIVEAAVVRHYAFAAMFITPLGIVLADAATEHQITPSKLIEARFLDTVLGCVVAVLGGVCIHSARFREIVGKPMRKLVPGRFVK